MRELGWGRIINVASVHGMLPCPVGTFARRAAGGLAGLVASPYKAAYVAAKHGVVGLTKARDT